MMKVMMMLRMVVMTMMMMVLKMVKITMMMMLLNMVMMAMMMMMLNMVMMTMMTQVILGSSTWPPRWLLVGGTLLTCILIGGRLHPS